MQVVVNPNRMELMRLKKRIQLSIKGHKLLKDKQEQLIRNFFAVVKEYRSLRKDVEAALSEGYIRFLFAKEMIGEKKIESALLGSKMTLKIEYGMNQIMNVKTPSFQLAPLEDVALSYSSGETSYHLDDAILRFVEVFKKLLSLAEKERTLVALAEEIISTRRRVNALEFVMIPQLQTASRFISEKIGEAERASITRLMFVKSIIHKEEG